MFMKKNLKTSRLDENRFLISSNKGFDITLFANKDVLVDKNSLLETINLMGIHETIENLNKNDFFGDYNGSLE
jgi:very-short-patch-repair endonuclease